MKIEGSEKESVGFLGEVWIWKWNGKGRRRRGGESGKYIHV